MRFPSFASITRSIYIITNTTARTFPATYRALTRPSLLRSSMPIPFLSSLFSTSTTRNMSHPIQKTDQEWQAILSPGNFPFLSPPLPAVSNIKTEQFRVVRKQGTEAPFTGKYDKHQPTTGTYNCVACDAPLYNANHKFKSGCGWPAFFDGVPGAITRHTDKTFGMERTEIVCSNCGGHLGHVFKGEGYATPTDERHCVNSVSLKFNDDKSEGSKV